MRNQHIKYSAFIAISIIVLSICWLVVNNHHFSNLSALTHMQNAQEIAKLSGQYQFRSEIDQIRNYEPRISNYARPSQHDQFVISGDINESTQTSQITMANANGIMLEIRRERGATYMRQPGSGWQRATTANSAAMINTLNFLAGVTNPTSNPNDPNSYQFGFDGAAFTDHFARLLKADASHGIKYNDEWYALAQSNQFSGAKGQGKFSIDNDGLPKAMELSFVVAGDQQSGSTTTTIKTAFFAYARTGLALQKLVNDPLRTLAQLLGSDTTNLRNGILGLMGILLIVVLGVLIQRFRSRLYFPITMLAIGIMLFQPFSSIPASQAANNTVSTPGPQDPNTPPSEATTQPPAPLYNPLLAPLNQMGGIALPSAGTSTSSGTIISQAGTSRTLSNRVANGLDTDKDNLSDEEEKRRRTDPNKADTDDDGLSDYDEVKLGTDPLVADKDKDNLNDFIEVQLGTNPSVDDSDHDNLSDFVEVTTFTQYTTGGNKFYTNPLTPDSNGDGILDGIECSAKRVAATNNCNDTNADNIPDFLSFDNDGDKVTDNYDISPNTRRTTVYNEAAPYTYQILNTATTVKPLLVDFQVRPSNDALLYANNAVYDWPTGDTDGQIQRGKDTTFANSTLFNSTNPNALPDSNGDMRLTAMLEIRIPISSSNYGNLPTTTCPSTSPITTTIQLNASDPNSCVDTSKTRPFALNVGWSRDSQGNVKNNEVTVSMPLNPNYDASGTIIGYAGTMYYATGPQAWQNDHQMRMQWVISAIQDNCPESKPNCSTSERVEKTTVVQNYYGDWKLIGMSATESSGVTAAVIAEDSTKPAVTDTSKRRLYITQLSDMLNDSFVAFPFLSIDGTDKNTSIAQLFDNTKNKNITATTEIYSMDKEATLVKTFKYATSYDIFKLSGTEIPTMLNDALCRKEGKTANCSEIATIRSTCENENKPTVGCQPAVIVVTENNERTAKMGSDNKFDFSGVDNIITRTKTGILFKVKAGSWQQAKSTDLANEFVEIIKSAPDTANPSPTTMSDEEWQKFQQRYIITSITSFASPESNAYPASLAPNLKTDTNQSSGSNPVLDDWGEVYTAVYTKFQELLESIWEKNTKELEQQNDFRDGVDSLTADIGSAIASFSGPEFQNALREFDFMLEQMKYYGIVVAQVDIDRSAVQTLKISGVKKIATMNLWVNRTGSALLIAKDVLNLIDKENLGPIANKIEIAGNSFALVSSVLTLYQVNKLSQILNNNGSTAGEAIEAASEALSSVSKKSKLAKYIGPVVGVVVAVVTMIMSLIQADYAWQSGNAIASAIGSVAAIYVLFVISAIPVMGQLIAAVIAVIDVLAALVCSALKEKDRRSTAGQWLCGGITGIFANIFTVYATNLMVDPDDPWSHTMQIGGSGDSKIKTPSNGFKVGNSFIYAGKVTDYIEKMPFPSTWMALPWFWQWNGMDPRESEFIYELHLNDQQDISYKLTDKPWNISGIWSDWVGNDQCPPNTTTCDYYADGDKKYSYRKSVTATAELPAFSQTGINVAMTPLYLTRAAQVPKQSCFLIIFVPVCTVSRHTAKPRHDNINEKSKLKFDIFPAKIGEFITMRSKNNGYTFNWSADTDTPSFPIFKDADNDGLSNDLEITRGSSDNNYDSDNDGVADNREYAKQTLVNVKDSDSDGLDDGQEYLYRTKPLSPDSDGDGLLDGEEVVRIDNTGKLVGGWAVTYAIVNGVAQTTWTGSDPNNADFDNDGITDLREKVLGWSPYGKNSGDILSVAGSVREAVQSNTADLIVRPGDKLITSINETNKLLGRSMQGYTTVSGVSTANGFQSDQITETALAAAASTSFDGTIELPGRINTATTPSSYANSCVFGATELCVKFDETNTTLPLKFNDLSSNNNPLSCGSTADCPVYNSTDGSWKFANTSYLQTTNTIGNNISNRNFSIAAWVRPEGQSVAMRTIASSTNPNAVLQVALNNERPQFSLGNNPTLIADAALPIGQWSHLVFVMNSQQLRQIYVNGVLVNSDPAPIGYAGSYGALLIGKDAGVNSFAGSLRDLQINSQALTQRQISALANTCEDPSLIACVPLTANDTTDYSSYGINQAVTLQPGPSGFSYKLPEGYASLLTEQNFTIISTVTLTNNTQTILQTGTPIAGGNSLEL
jgi:hypothetical protein